VRASSHAPVAPSTFTRLGCTLDGCPGILGVCRRAGPPGSHTHRERDAAGRLRATTAGSATVTPCRRPAI